MVHHYLLELLNSPQLHLGIYASSPRQSLPGTTTNNVHVKHEQTYSFSTHALGLSFSSSKIAAAQGASSIMTAHQPPPLADIRVLEFAGLAPGELY